MEFDNNTLQILVPLALIAMGIGLPSYYKYKNTRMSKRRLYVVKIDTARLRENWGTSPLKGEPECMFVRSNGAGHIDWDSTVAYKAEELVGRDNVRVIPEFVPAIIFSPIFESDERL